MLFYVGPKLIGVAEMVKPKYWDNTIFSGPGYKVYLLIVSIILFHY